MKTKCVYIIVKQLFTIGYYRRVYMTQEAARKRKATLPKYYKIFKVNLEMVR
jgi:hypothetical protein